MAMGSPTTKLLAGDLASSSPNRNLLFSSSSSSSRVSFAAPKHQRRLHVLALAVKRSPKRLKYSAPRFTKEDELLYVEVDPSGVDSWKLEPVVDLLKQGAVGIIPTDTVYAIVCDPRNHSAVDVFRESRKSSRQRSEERNADGVEDKQEAVAVTTAIQEEILLEMGIDPRVGISCLGKVNMKYENHQDMMIRFYKFIEREELACDEAELGPDEFAEWMQIQEKLHEQQLEMLKHMRKFPLDDQSAILEKLRQHMEIGKFEDAAPVLSSEQIQEIVRRRVSPLFNPSR